MREIVPEELEKLGLDKTKHGLHSFRSGGTTDAARAGVPDRLFQKHGRWQTAEVKNSYVLENVAERLNVGVMICDLFDNQ